MRRASCSVRCGKLRKKIFNHGLRLHYSYSFCFSSYVHTIKGGSYPEIWGDEAEGFLCCRIGTAGGFFVFSS